MLGQIVIGVIVITLSIVALGLCFGIAERVFHRNSAWLTCPPYQAKRVVALVGMTLWLVCAHAVGVGLWALTFLILEIFEAAEPAIYFAVVAFTTLGFGDVLLAEEWRLLSGLCAANGLLVFGVSTAVLVELLIRVRRAQNEGH